MNSKQVAIGPLQIGIIVLTLITAAIHLQLVFPSVMFILNGLGYLGLLAAYFLPLPFFKDNRRLVRWAFMGFTLVTILAWVFIGSRIPIAYITKVFEVALIALLWFDRSS
jgi:hypothetical protein